MADFVDFKAVFNKQDKRRIFNGSFNNNNYYYYCYAVDYERRSSHVVGRISLRQLLDTDVLVVCGKGEAGVGAHCTHSATALNTASIG